MSFLGRGAFRATAALRSKEAARTARKEDAAALRRGLKRDPELFPLYFIMVGVFAWAGYHFVSAPTGADDKSGVSAVPNSEPWKNEGTKGKYQYYVRGDKTMGLKDHPSALNTTIIPNVTLPKELHEKYNKYGKPGWDH